MDRLERSAFAMSASELEISEAVLAMQRVLDQPDLGRAARDALERAIRTLRGEPS